MRQQEQPIGTATIIYRQLEPPRLTGNETIEQLGNYGVIARRVMEEFHELNPDINLETWGAFRANCMTTKLCLINGVRLHHTMLI
jgi:hypothetical protein